MALSELLASLRTDLGDEAGDLFQDATLTRCILKSVFRLSRDLALAMTVANGQIVPEPFGENRELLLLLARINACQVMRTATANAFSFSSGDKRVDKSKQPESWAKLEVDLTAQYKARLAELKPNASLTEDYFVTPQLNPLIFEQGSHRRCRS